MFGDAYIQLRAQVGTALFSLARMAQEFSAPPEAIAELHQLQEGFRVPFLFVAIGDARAGKSTLLDALFGREFTGAPAPTERLTVFRHAAESRDAELPTGGIERLRSHNFLRDFTVVDTPPIDMRAEVGAELAPFIAEADLLLFTFSSDNLESERAWRLLLRINKDRLKRGIFVVDSSGEVSLDEAAKRLRQVMLKRLGQASPIFSVDLRRAVAARMAQDSASLAASGIVSIEEYIDREVAGGLARRAPVDLARGRAREILQELTAGPRDIVLNAARDTKRLEDLHVLIEERKDQSLRQMGGLLWSLTQALELAQKRGEDALSHHLALPALLRLGSGWREEIDRDVEARLRETVRQQLDSALEATTTDQCTVWAQLEAERKRAFPEADAMAPDFADYRDRLRGELDAAVVKHSVDESFDRRMRSLFFLAAVCLRTTAFLVFGGILLAIFAALGHPSPLLITLGVLGVVALAVLTLALWQWKLLSEFRRFATVRREALVGAVEDHLRATIDHFAEDLADSLGPLQVACAARRRVHEPMLLRADQLDERFAKSQPGTPDAAPAVE